MSRRVRALTVTDLRVALRDGEQLLLTLGIPVALLVFFSLIDVLPVDGEPVDHLAPGILALALISVAFVRLAIALGFDRGFGAIARFATTPVRVGEFFLSKLATTVILATAQLTVLTLVAVALGWRPDPSLLLVPAVTLALVAFVALGFLVAGLTEGLRALALANAAYIALLLVSGIVVELDRFPGWIEAIVRWLPSTAAVALLRAGLGPESAPGWAWVCLVGWAVAASLLAVRTFRYR